jgi:hypothetical protein
MSDMAPLMPLTRSTGTIGLSEWGTVPVIPRNGMQSNQMALLFCLCNDPIKRSGFSCLYFCINLRIYNAHPCPATMQTGQCASKFSLPPSTFIFCWYDPLQTLALQNLQHFPAIEIRMPPSKPKPSEIAVEAKKSYIPYIRTNFSTQWPSTSYLCHSESVRSPPGNAALRINPRFGISYKVIYLRENCSFLTAFYARDPVDLALDWSDPSDAQQNPPLKPVVVIMPANEKRPGGDWEAGTRINHTRKKRDLSLPI